MKKIIIFAILLLSSLNISYSQSKIDVSKKPEPLAEKEFIFPKYSETTLKNGLKVFIIEDHEQPTISINLLVAGGTSMDGDKLGTAELLAEVITKGAGKRSALDIAKALDGVGSSIKADASADEISISSFTLKKHLPIILDIFGDIVTKPTFPQDEIDKAMPRFEAAIKQERGNPSSLSGMLSRIAIYGPDHPYSKKKTVESIKSININDILKYYKAFFRPNNSTIAIVGDVSSKEIIEQLNKVFASWEQEKVPVIKLPEPKPQPKGVYFVKRAGSAQTSVLYATLTVPYSNKEYDGIGLAANVIGGSFSGRLFRTLREKYSYTYTPFGFQSRSKYINRFACGADVRVSTTDSAMKIIKELVDSLCTSDPSKEELGRVKKYLVGRYLMSFESSEFISDLIQNADFYGVPLSYVKSYPERIMKMTPFEVRHEASKYMDSKKAYWIVVGLPSVEDKISPFGKIYEYDLDLHPVMQDTNSINEIKITPQEIIQKYTNAIGGKENINKINTLITESTAKLFAQGHSLPGKSIKKQSIPDKAYDIIDFGMFKQEFWVLGPEVWSKNQESMVKVDGVEQNELREEGMLFKDTKILELGYQCDVIGKKNGQIILKASNQTGSICTYYFDAETFLISKTEQEDNSVSTDPSSMEKSGAKLVTTTYKNYIRINDVMLPKNVEIENSQFTISFENSYKINEPIDDRSFSPNESDIHPAGAPPKSSTSITPPTPAKLKPTPQK